MNALAHNGFEIIIPEPLFLVVEDVGWWQGQDSSTSQQPFRSGMPRNHCPADYEALAYLAGQLSMRILLGMVMCEWDRSDFLRNVPGATWMGESWDNRINRGPWLEEAADCLRKNQDRLEIALHGVGHEFWQDQVMHRSEFHDNDCWMRPPQLIRAHLDAFGELLYQNDLGPFPRCFIPPALKHSFGNGPDSFQAILRPYGFRFLTTIFSEARRFTLPHAKRITWEEDVLLVERGLSPVPWREVAAVPRQILNGPVIALHWANLLHEDPARNVEVVSEWINTIRKSANNAATMLVPDVQSCWSQYCHQQLAQIVPRGSGVVIDRSELPPSSCQVEKLFLRIKRSEGFRWDVRGGSIAGEKKEEDGKFLFELRATDKELHLLPIAD